MEHRSNQDRFTLEAIRRGSLRFARGILALSTLVSLLLASAASAQWQARASAGPAPNPTAWVTAKDLSGITMSPGGSGSRVESCVNRGSVGGTFDSPSNDRPGWYKDGFLRAWNRGELLPYFWFPGPGIPGHFNDARILLSSLPAHAYIDSGAFTIYIVMYPHELHTSAADPIEPLSSHATPISFVDVGLALRADPFSGGRAVGANAHWTPADPAVWDAVEMPLTSGPTMNGYAVPQVWKLEHSGGVLSLSRDVSAPGTVDCGTTNGLVAELRIGHNGQAFPYGQFHGAICEWIIYDRALSSSEHFDTIKYLFSEWRTSSPGFGGQVTTIAGTGDVGYAGHGGQATSALLHDPQGIGIDAQGNIYFADNLNFVIRRIDTNGVITTVAGNGVQGFSGDGGAATSASLGGPVGIHVSWEGDILVADMSNHSIRRIDSTSGIIFTIAGDGLAGFSGDGGAATAARLNSPQGVSRDLDGNIYIADTLNFRVRRVDANTGVITTVCGTGIPTSSGDGGQATSADLSSPRRVTVDPASNVFILDRAENARIRRIDGATGIITTVAGGGVLTDYNGPAIQMNLGPVTDVAMDGFDLIVATSFGVWHVSQGTATTIGGTGAQGFSGDGGHPLLAEFNNISGAVVDPLGQILLSDRSNQRIRNIGFGIFTLPELIITETTSESVLDHVITIEQGLIMLDFEVSCPTCPNRTDVDASTSLIVPMLESVGLDFIVTANDDLVFLETPGLLSIGGTLQIDHNVVLTQIALPSLLVVGGGLSFDGNSSATSILLEDLEAVGGSLIVSGNGGGGLALGAVPVLRPRGVFQPTSSQIISFDSLTSVAGSLTIVDNPTMVVSLPALENVGGSLTLETGVQEVIDLASATVAGDMSVEGVGATTFLGNIADGATDVIFVNDETTMSLVLPDGSFDDAVPFAIDQLSPGSLALVRGFDAAGNSVIVDPVSAYEFAFGSAQLDEDAVLTFHVDLSSMNPEDAAALVAALDDGRATIAVKDGGAYQAFPVCSSGEAPTTGGCASVSQVDKDTVVFQAVADFSSGSPTRFAVCVIRGPRASQPGFLPE